MFLCSYSYDIVDPVFDSFVWEIYVNSRRANLVASESKGSESADEVSLAFFVDRVASRDLTGHGSARIALKGWFIRFFNNNKLSQEQSKKTPRKNFHFEIFFLDFNYFFPLTWHVSVPSPPAQIWISLSFFSYLLLQLFTCQSGTIAFIMWLDALAVVGSEPWKDKFIIHVYTDIVNCIYAYIIRPALQETRQTRQD